LSFRLINVLYLAPPISQMGQSIFDLSIFFSELWTSFPFLFFFCLLYFFTSRPFVLSHAASLHSCFHWPGVHGSKFWWCLSIYFCVNFMFYIIIDGPHTSDSSCIFHYSSTKRHNIVDVKMSHTIKFDQLLVIFV
jgi:hypothetical protein